MIKVSVITVTYNHEPFIARTIEGVLMQKTNFDVEHLIGDDCSTDGTREIVVDYAKRHPHRIKAFISEKNMGGKANVRRLREAAQGQYIAMLDGDDYWTSPDKLQKQVDFLDANPDYAICFHPVKMEWDDGSHESFVYYPGERKDTYILEELLRYNFMGSCSIVYRRGLFNEYPDWFARMPIGDWTMQITNAHYGKIGYIDECMGVYRQHGGGIFAQKDQAGQIEVAIKAGHVLKDGLDEKYKKYVRAALCENYHKLATVYYDAGDYANARLHLRNCLREVRYNLHVPFLSMMQLVIKALLPRTYKGCKAILCKLIGRK